ncbi:MAG: bifunctional riboflavin kinase/FAD synthetase [Aestuariibacter sp.]
MELIRGLHNLRQRHRGCVLSIGKFDGVHLGHVAVLTKLVAQARAMQLPSAVMVFEPQPEELFMPDKAPARLTRLREKYMAMQNLGVDRLICVRFNRQFANQPAEYFVEQLLVQKLGIQYLVVGDDFRFGKGRTGDFALLQAEGKECGFDVVNTQSFCLGQDRISSSAIRQALAKNELTLAKQMLGRDFSISGRVVHGDKRGRTIGFPTANVLLKRCKSPVSGVYAVNVVWNGNQHAGIANVGNRPTVEGTRAQLEVHLFDFNADLYGQFIEVRLLSKIREEQKFPSVTALQQQIDADVLVAKNWFSQNEKTITEHQVR